jgi:MFS family permease
LAGERDGRKQRADFKRLWFGQTVSQVGTQITLLALPLLAITTLHATPFQVGLLAAVETFPFLLVGLPAGVWVDRTRRRPLLILTDVGRALLLATIPVAKAAGGLTLAQLFAVAFGIGILTVLFDVAYLAYLPSIVDAEALLRANSRLEISRSGAELVGPGLGGALVQALTAPYAILVDSVSYVASAIGLLTIRTPEPDLRADHTERPSMGSAIAEGLRHVLGHPVLARIAGTMAVYNLFSAMGMAVFLLYAVRTLGLSPATVGLLFSVGAAGFVAGAAVSERVGRRLGVGPTMTLSGIAQTVPFVLVPLAPRHHPIPFFVAALLLEQGANPIFNVTQVSVRQVLTPAHLQGRMTASMRFLVWGTLPLGSLIGGALGTWLGLHTTLWIAALGGCLGAIPLLGRRIWRLREMPTGPAAPEPVRTGGGTVVLRPGPSAEDGL